ncbi:hypothetical protein Tsubulata_018457 [Turnera subulata]|uniref:Protein CHUP1, chloroplastic n=1 Tax=Turnera subulata TaxID=218843 RepID=A0A9Q0GGP8_9ROSI|nr:hypothetical protein Tsubulata_018457 [Turnera subulata]
MDGTTTKIEVMKPILLKAGIASLALSVAGFMYARIIANRVLGKPPPWGTNVSSLESMDSDEENSDGDGCKSLKEDEGKVIASLDNRESFSVREEILGLKSRTEELEKKQWDLARQLICYRDMREQESVLMELKNMLSSQTARVEFLDREISSLEAEKRRFDEGSAVEYVKLLLGQLESAKTENGLLQRKATKLSRKNKEQSRVIREKNWKINAAEKAILRFSDTLETRAKVMENLEDEVRELQIIVDQLEKEKGEILAKLNLVENSASSISKIETTGVRMEEYNQLVHELDQLKKGRAAEITELIYLRWSNACLRHELMRSHDEQQQYHHQQIEEKHNYLELELEPSGEIKDCSLEHQGDSPILGSSSGGPALTPITSGHLPKRKRLLQKLKKWVDGSENAKPKLDYKEKRETKCFGRLSVSEEGEEDDFIHARKSCSSA